MRLNGVDALEARLNGQVVWSAEAPSIVYATFDPAKANALAVLSAGNLRLHRTVAGANWAVALATAPLAGKAYFEGEVDITTGGSSDVGVGVLSVAAGVPGTGFIGARSWL